MVWHKPAEQTRATEVAQRFKEQNTTTEPQSRETLQQKPTTEPQSRQQWKQKAATEKKKKISNEQGTAVAGIIEAEGEPRDAGDCD